MKLIYHKQNNSGDISPFDAALLQVSNNANPLYLASPYIGLSFLNRILDNAEDWKLLSDIEAWLSSGNRRHRARCWQFIINNLDRIKHVPGLHAKVAIGNNLLFLGSANFTDKGMLGRDELSILVDDPKIINESLKWFNGLWDSASAPVINEGDELVKALDELQWTAPRSRIKLSSSSVKVKSILATSNRPTGFDVASSFTKSSLTESFTLLPIEEAYQKISDDWFSSERSFTFKELLNAVSEHQPSTTTTELWTLVIRETVNHWLGGLFIDGFDRYIYKDNKFEKWGNSKLATVVKVDNLLKFVIETISLAPETSFLPFEEYWLDIGVPEHHILTIVDQLINIGLLVEIDNPGEVEMYSIDFDFEWPKRWQKFTQAFKAFKDKEKILKPITKSSDGDEDDDWDDEFKDSSSYLDNLKINKSLKKLSVQSGSLTSELKSTAIKLGITANELINKRDQILISVLRVIESKEPNLLLKDIKLINAELNNGYMPVKLLGVFADFNNGPFVRIKSLRGIRSRHSSSDHVILSKNWPYSRYLTLYPQALNQWKKLTEKKP